MSARDSLLHALHLALDEERGRLIVALYDMPIDDLEGLVEAVQMIDSEGVEALELRERPESRSLSSAFPGRPVIYADADYVLRWLEQTSAPENIIGLQRRVLAATPGRPVREPREPTDLEARKRDDAAVAEADSDVVAVSRLYDLAEDLPAPVVVEGDPVAGAMLHTPKSSNKGWPLTALCGICGQTVGCECASAKNYPLNRESDEDYYARCHCDSGRCPVHGP